MMEETKEETKEDNDVFFELYATNIACYYNSKTILKLLNKTTNISRNVNEILQAYEDNSERIKEFNNKTYNQHIISIKSVLSRLFEEEKQKHPFLYFEMSNVKSWSFQKGNDLKSYIKDMYETFPDIKFSSFIPTEKRMHETLETIENGMHKTFEQNISLPIKNRSNRREENKRIEKKFNQSVDKISDVIFFQ